MKIEQLPNDDPSCGWYHTSFKRTPKAAHRGNSHARFVVLGAGYTGLACARQLANNFPSDEIVLIEAQEVGFGAAGRNAGFMIDLPHDIGAADYIGDINTAKTTLKLNKLGQSILREQVEKYQIQCHMHAIGKYQGAVEPKGIAVLDAYCGGLDKLGEPYEVISGRDLPNHIGTKFYRKALLTPGTILMQPSALVKGLADNLPANVKLYENTPINAVEYGDKVTLRHKEGKIEVDKLILANNSFGRYFGFLKNNMLSIFLYASLTRVLTEAEQKLLGGKDFWGLIPADPHGSTVRRTPDQRILIRNSVSFGKNGQPSAKNLHRFIKNHRISFENRFPILGNVPFEYSWSGILAMTHNHKGFFGQLAPNVYANLGCNGLGVTNGTVAGQLLADWIAGKNDHDDLIKALLKNSGPSKLPPEPFLTLGVNATLQLGQLKAGLER